MSDMPELKPCPFCGGQASLRDDSAHRTAFYVGCQTLGCFGSDQWDETMAEAVGLWNTRADATLTPAEAMERCPEVAALVGVVAETAGLLQQIDESTRNMPPEMEGLSAYECSELATHLDAAIDPFTKGSD